MNGMSRYLEKQLREEYAELTIFVETETDMAADWHHDYHAAASPLASECGVCTTYVQKYARYIQLRDLIAKLDEIDNAGIDIFKKFAVQ